MRKTIITFLLIFSLLLVPFTTIAEDISSMTDEELNQKINLIRAELETRKQNEEKIIAQADGITAYFNDLKTEESYDDTIHLEVYITVINTGDKSVSLTFNKASINGWDVSTLGLVTLEPGKKAKYTLDFYEVDRTAEIKSADEIEDLDFYSYTYDPDSYQTLTEGIKGLIKLK